MTPFNTRCLNEMCEGQMTQTGEQQLRLSNRTIGMQEVHVIAAKLKRKFK